MFFWRTRCAAARDRHLNKKLGPQYWLWSFSGKYFELSTIAPNDVFMQHGSMSFSLIMSGIHIFSFHNWKVLEITLETSEKDKKNSSRFKSRVKYLNWTPTFTALSCKYSDKWEKFHGLRPGLGVPDLQIFI